MKEKKCEVVKERKCEIYYFSDMQKCMTCGAAWDANDPYPPKCMHEKTKKPGFFERLIAHIFGDKAA